MQVNTNSMISKDYAIIILKWGVYVKFSIRKRKDFTKKERKRTQLIRRF